VSDLNDAIQPIDRLRDRRGNLTTDVSKIIVEEVANALRREWKEELKQDLRERARRGFFKQ
jgi:hypothetical protein